MAHLKNRRPMSKDMAESLATRGGPFEETRGGYARMLDEESETECLGAKVDGARPIPFPGCTCSSCGEARACQVRESVAGHSSRADATQEQRQAQAAIYEKLTPAKKGSV